MTKKKADKLHFFTFLETFSSYFVQLRAIFIGLIIIILVNSLLISYIEGMQLNNSIYFSFITVFTIGYGDIVPITGTGRFLSLLNGLFGLILAGLIAGITTASVIKRTS